MLSVKCLLVCDTPQLADQPAKLIEDVLGHVGKVSKLIRSPGNVDTTAEMPACQVARFLFLIGHAGIRQMVFLDQTVYKELKRRNAVREKKKELKSRVSNIRRRKSMNVSTMSTVSTMSSASVQGSAQRSIRGNKNDDDQEEMEGATADDADAEHINMCLEEELLAEGGYISKFM